MKALTLWEPWATAIAIRLKTIETRGWATAYRGPLAIHAAADKNEGLWHWKQMTEADRDVFTAAGFLAFHGLPFGRVVAIVELSDCKRSEFLTRNKLLSEREERWGNYGPTRFGWMLKDVSRLQHPVPARGMQQLWDWNRDQQQPPETEEGQTLL